MHEVNYLPDPRGDFLIAAGTDSPAVPVADEDTMTSLGLTAGITAFWKMDEDSGDRVDVSGNSRTLTQQGAVGADTGLLGSAALFTGDSSDYLSSSESAFNPNEGVLTVSCWVKLSGILDSQVLISKWTPAPVPDGWRLEYDFADNAFAFHQGESNVVTDDRIVSAHPVVSGVWYHIVAGFDGENHFIAINNLGRELDGGFPATNSVNDLMVGRDIAGSDVLDGLIDEVGIWVGTVLTDEQITALYNGGTPLPFS